MFHLPQAEGSLFLLLLCLPPSGKADLGTCAGFSMRDCLLFSGGWSWVLSFVGQSLHLDAGRDMSRGVFWGNCEWSMILSSLSSDDWGCVPLLLVLWPEAFQRWILQVFQWGQVLVLKVGPPGELMAINTPWGCPCSHSGYSVSPSMGAPTLKPHWPSRLNALGGFLHARYSDCLGGLFLCKDFPV